MQRQIQRDTYTEKDSEEEICRAGIVSVTFVMNGGGLYIRRKSTNFLCL